MTRQEAIDAAPSSRRRYLLSLVLGTLMCLAFFKLMLFATRESRPVVAVVVLSVLVALALTAQYVERFFYPERAAVRSASLSDEQRLWMRRGRTLLLMSSATVWLVLIVLSRTSHNIPGDLQILWLVPLILTAMIADLQGERIGGRRFERGANLL